MKTLFAVIALLASAAVLAADLPVLKWQNGGEFDAIVSNGHKVFGITTITGPTLGMTIDCDNHQFQLNTLAGQKDIWRPIDMSKSNRGKDIVDSFCGKILADQTANYSAHSINLPAYQAPDIHGDILRQEIMAR